MLTTFMGKKIRTRLVSIGFPITASLILFGCSSQLASIYEGQHHTDLAIDQVRLEVADLKHALSNQKVEFQILEEKLSKQENGLASVKNEGQPVQQSKLGEVRILLSSLEKRIVQLEKVQEKISSDLKQLSNHAQQTTTSLQQYREKIHECEQASASQAKRLDEISKLKSTLNAISQAMHQNPPSDGSVKTYRVQSGDSLDKIARREHVSIEAIKKCNPGLAENKIFAGQEIKIPQ